MKHRLLSLIILVLLVSACSSPTEEEALFQEIIQSDPQFTSDGRNCGKILETEARCSVVLTVTNVTRPEWTSLFPTTKFFLVKRNVLGQETGFQSNWLIAKQDHQQFTVDTFDKLLTTNGTAITDQNRELIAQAFASMTLADYLEGKVNFTKWEKVNLSKPAKYDYNYHLMALTEIGAVEVDWWYVFADQRLEVVSGPQHYFPVSNSHVQLPPLHFKDYEFRFAR